MKKTRPNDGSYSYYKIQNIGGDYDDDYDNVDEEEKDKEEKKKNEDEEVESERSRMRREDELFMKEAEDLMRERKEREKKIKEDFEKAHKSEIERRKEREKRISMERSERKYALRKSEGVFRHKALHDFGTKGMKKINRALLNVRVPKDKKEQFVKALNLYVENKSANKSVLKKDEFKKYFLRGIKSGVFSGESFRRMKRKNVDLKSLRKGFNRTIVNRMARAITGEEDPNKYKASKDAGATREKKTQSLRMRARIR